MESACRNGDVVPKENARQFLDIIKQVQPRPLLVLSYSPIAHPRRVQRTRKLINDVLECSPRYCLEVTRATR
jgi:hypothetical protein